MQAIRLDLRTDQDGRIHDLPPLPANTHLEAILLVLDVPSPAPARRRQPSERIAGLGAIYGDLTEPAVDADDWDALR